VSASSRFINELLVNLKSEQEKEVIFIMERVIANQLQVNKLENNEKNCRMIANIFLASGEELQKLYAKRLGYED
jgi:hypothetical protein